MRTTKDHLPWEKNKLFWVCPECGEVNAYSYDDAERASKKLKGVKVFICHGSCFDNICGNCSSNIVKPDSPILASCYTHEGD